MLPEDTIKTLIREFLNDKRKKGEEVLFKKGVDGKPLTDFKKAKIYNEFSLQHELGIFFRDRLKEIDPDFKIHFERNVKDFYGDVHYDDSYFVKHEMDIVIFKDFDKDSEKYAIELKFPTNGAARKRMYQFVEDIKFMEQVANDLNFTKTFCLALISYSARGNLFRDDSKDERDKDEIYQYFRDSKEKLPIQKDFVNKDKKDRKTGKQIEYHIDGSYPINWENIGDSKYYYYLLETEKKRTGLITRKRGKKIKEYL